MITKSNTKRFARKFYPQNKRKNIKKMQNFFAEFENGELFMILGSSGFLEIVDFQSSAAKLLKVKSGQKVILKK